jgi:glycosyltransferase involved in cell wall biosynthesis
VSGAGVVDRPPVVSVVVCAYTERRWDLLTVAVESLMAQRRPADQVVLVIDHNEALLARARRAFPAVTVVANEQPRGLSGARNTGVQHSHGEVIAFLDDDARAHADWLAALVDALDRPAVMGAGGVAHPVWESRRPAWMPQEFLWVVGASYRGLPVGESPVRNPIGATMAFRREAFEAAGPFTDGVGRVGRIPLGCEETEFAIRVRQTRPGSVVLHVPGARVDHHIPAERATWRYFVSRCWAEGVSKARVSALVGSGDGLSAERSYVARTLPAGVLAGLREAARGDAAGLARSGAIVAGTAITAAGYVRGRVQSARRGHRSSTRRQDAR